MICRQHLFRRDDVDRHRVRRHCRQTLQNAVKSAPSVKDLAERYLREHAEPRKKPKSVANDRLLLRKHILPTLGQRRVGDVTRADIEKLHLRIGKQAPTTANRAIAMLSKSPSGFLQGAAFFCLVFCWKPGCRSVNEFAQPVLGCPPSVTQQPVESRRLALRLRCELQDRL